MTYQITVKFDLIIFNIFKIDKFTVLTKDLKES